MGFEFADATAGDLAEVAAAGAAFRRHWESFQNMQPTPAFDGGLEDITALDFLDYEQLGTPDGGLRLAALAWGQRAGRAGGLAVGPRRQRRLVARRRSGGPGGPVAVCPAC